MYIQRVVCHSQKHNVITMKTTVVVIDDHPLLLRGVVQLFELADDFELVGATSDGDKGVDLVSCRNPDLVLLDLNMGETSGIEVLSKIKAGENTAKVVILTVSNTPDDLKACLKAGADGYLLKDMEPEEILVKLRQAHDSEFVMTEPVTVMLAKAMMETDQPVNLVDAGLTPREEEILRQIVNGHRNKAIGRLLDISDGTVKVHVKNLLRKLNVCSRLEAAIWGINNGYAKPEDTFEEHSHF